jgi:hypothetical protein
MPVTEPTLGSRARARARQESGAVALVGRGAIRATNANPGPPSQRDLQGGIKARLGATGSAASNFAPPI